MQQHMVDSSAQPFCSSTGGHDSDGPGDDDGGRSDVFSKDSRGQKVVKTKVPNFQNSELVTITIPKSTRRQNSNSNTEFVSLFVNHPAQILRNHKNPHFSKDLQEMGLVPLKFIDFNHKFFSLPEVMYFPKDFFLNSFFLFFCLINY